jgi:hypothetical protein
MFCLGTQHLYLAENEARENAQGSDCDEMQSASHQYGMTVFSHVQLSFAEKQDRSTIKSDYDVLKNSRDSDEVPRLIRATEIGMSSPSASHARAICAS